MARSISSSNEFFLRFIMQLLMIAVLWQIVMSPRRVIKSFHQMVAAGQKYKFRVSKIRESIRHYITLLYMTC